jgi:hypothetical protein
LIICITLQQVMDIVVERYDLSLDQAKPVTGGVLDRGGKEVCPFSGPHVTSEGTLGKQVPAPINKNRYI